MATNADKPEATESQETETLTQDDEKLRQDLKDSLANDTKTAAVEAETTVPNTDETVEAEGIKPEATLTNEVPPEPAKDLNWYKTAYENSTTEAMRLKAELDKKVETPPPPAVLPPVTDEVLTPEQLYIRQKQNEEITEAFNDITTKYPDLKDKPTYDKFVAEANVLGRVIVETEKRFPSPKELYDKTVVIMGLQPDNSEALGSALKDSAATPRTVSGPAAPAPQSKVTEAMIAMNLKMYPTKSRQEIIEELEPHIN